MAERRASRVPSAQPAHVAVAEMITAGDIASLMKSLQVELQSDLTPEHEALDRAQELVFDAWEAPTPRRRLTLARKALSISPLCADAISILAEAESPGSDRALDLYRKAVSAGEAAIGPGGFAAFAGSFWGYLQTRPYMRARHGLVDCLRARGSHDDAAVQMAEMLALNPNDNQGVRYELMSCLQHLRREDDLATLLQRYPERSAAWTYTDAFAAFRRSGATPDSVRRLKVAIRSNRHVPAFLLGLTPLPAKQPEFIGVGDVYEAVAYATENLDDWTDCPGALDWLGSTLPKPRRKMAP